MIRNTETVAFFLRITYMTEPAGPMRKAKSAGSKRRNTLEERDHELLHPNLDDNDFAVAISSLAIHIYDSGKHTNSD